MKKFNQTIQIEFQVDAIASQLRAMFNDSANADLVVEQIIGRSLNNDMPMLSRIVSAINGVQNEVFVEVGKTYPIKPMRIYGFWTPESIVNNESCYGDVTEAHVLDINIYKDEQVKISYLVPNKSGEKKEQTKWVNANQFTI